MGGSCVTSSSRANYAQQSQFDEDCCSCSAPESGDYDQREVEGGYVFSTKNNSAARGSSPSRQRKEIFSGTYIDKYPRLKQDASKTLRLTNPSRSPSISPSKQQQSYVNARNFGAHHNTEQMKVKANYQEDINPTFANMDEPESPSSNRIVEDVPELSPERVQEWGEMSSQGRPQGLSAGYVNKLTEEHDQDYHTIHFSRPQEKSSGLTDSPNPAAERKHGLIDSNEPVRPMRIENKPSRESTQPFESPLASRKSDPFAIDFPAQSFLINYTNPFGLTDDAERQPQGSHSRKSSNTTIQILNFQKPKPIPEINEHVVGDDTNPNNGLLTPEKYTFASESGSPKDRLKNFSRSAPFHPSNNQNYKLYSENISPKQRRKNFNIGLPFHPSLAEKYRREIEERINNSLNQSQDFNYSPSPPKKNIHSLPENIVTLGNEEPEIRNYTKIPVQQHQQRPVPALKMPLDRVKTVQEQQTPVDINNSFLRHPLFEKYRSQNFEGVPIYRAKTPISDKKEIQKEKQKSPPVMRKPNISAYFEATAPNLMITQAHCPKCEIPVERARFYPTHSFFGHPIFERPDCACAVHLETEGHSYTRSEQISFQATRSGHPIHTLPSDLPMSDVINRREITEGPKAMTYDKDKSPGKENPNQQQPNRGRCYSIIKGPNLEHPFLVINKERNKDSERPIETYIDKKRKKDDQINDPFLQVLAKTFVAGDDDKNRRKSKALIKLEQSARSVNSIGDPVLGTDEGVISSSRLLDKDSTPAERKTADFLNVMYPEPSKGSRIGSYYETPQVKSEAITDVKSEGMIKPVIRLSNEQLEKKKDAQNVRSGEERTRGKDAAGGKTSVIPLRLKDVESKSQQRLGTLTSIEKLPENRSQTQGTDRSRSGNNDSGSFQGKYARMRPIEQPKKAGVFDTRDEMRKPGGAVRGVGSKIQHESGYMNSGSEDGRAHTFESAAANHPTRSSGAEKHATAAVRKSLPALEMSQVAKTNSQNSDSLRSKIYRSLNNV